MLLQHQHPDLQPTHHHATQQKMQPRFPVGKLAALRNLLQDLLAPCLQPAHGPLTNPYSLDWGHDHPSVLGTGCPGLAAPVGELYRSRHRDSPFKGAVPSWEVCAEFWKNLHVQKTNILKLRQFRS